MCSEELLFNESLLDWGLILNNFEHTEVRFSTSEFESLTETIISGSMVAIIIYSDEPKGILIDDAIVAESYKKYFSILWKLAKK